MTLRDAIILIASCSSLIAHGLDTESSATSPISGKRDAALLAELSKKEEELYRSKLERALEGLIDSHLLTY